MYLENFRRPQAKPHRTGNTAVEMVSFCEWFLDRFSHDSDGRRNDVPQIPCKLSFYTCEHVQILWHENMKLEDVFSCICIIIHQFKIYIFVQMKTKWSEMYIDDIILLLTFYVVFWYNRHSVCFRLCQGRAETHRNRGDMIEVYKILTGKYDPTLPSILHHNINSTTRDNPLKLCTLSSQVRFMQIQLYG